MTQSIFTIIENRALTSTVYKMVLEGDTSAITKPGQFVNIKLEGKFLRRPISVCDWAGNSLTIIYKVVGEGTDMMAKMGKGEKVSMDVLERICRYLNCDLGDIASFEIEENNDGSK